ncbi:MAG: hypothetical protein WBG92_05875 [Thiohalocapsa sp.]
MNIERQTLNPSTCQPARGKIARSLCLTAVLAVVATGCASIRLDPLVPDAVEIERVDSPKAHITTVQVRDRDGRLKVNGRLQKRHRGSGFIPGHLHIEAVGEDGGTLAQVTTGYRRINRKSQTSTFTEVLDIRPAQVATVRVIHHRRNDDENATIERPRPSTSRGVRDSTDLA